MNEDDAKLVLNMLCFLPRHCETALRLFKEPSELGNRMRKFIGKNVDFAADFEKTMADINKASDLQIKKTVQAVIKGSKEAKEESQKAAETVRAIRVPHIRFLKAAKELLNLMLEAGKDPAMRAAIPSNFQEDMETYLGLLQNHYSTLTLQYRMTKQTQTPLSLDNADFLPLPKCPILGRTYWLLAEAEMENAREISQQEDELAALVCHDFRQQYGNSITEETLYAFEKNAEILSMKMRILRRDMASEGKHAHDARILLSFPDSGDSAEIETPKPPRIK
ncbi:MAG: hypothetical protein V1746_08340 [bacterium]